MKGETSRVERHGGGVEREEEGETRVWAMTEMDCSPGPCCMIKALLVARAPIFRIMSHTVLHVAHLPCPTTRKKSSSAFSRQLLGSHRGAMIECLSRRVCKNASDL
jgi:hypothetical protein